MGKFRSEGEIDPYVAKLIRHKGWILVGSYGFTWADRQDIEQDLTLEYLKRLKNFNAAKSSLHTFASMVINNAVATMVEARKAAKRDYRLCRKSLDEPLPTKKGEDYPNSVGETYSEEEYRRRTRNFGRSFEEQQDLATEVNGAISTLPPELREICEKLKYASKSGAARSLGISRSKLNSEIQKIRKRFEEKDLDIYVVPGGVSSFWRAKGKAWII